MGFSLTHWFASAAEALSVSLLSGNILVSRKSSACWNMCALGVRLSHCVTPTPPPSLPSSGQENDSSAYFPSDTKDKMDVLWSVLYIILQKVTTDGLAFFTLNKCTYNVHKYIFVCPSIYLSIYLAISCLIDWLPDRPTYLLPCWWGPTIFSHGIDDCGDILNVNVYWFIYIVQIGLLCLTAHPVHFRIHLHCCVSCLGQQESAVSPELSCAPRSTGSLSTVLHSFKKLITGKLEWFVVDLEDMCTSQWHKSKNRVLQGCVHDFNIDSTYLSKTCDSLMMCALSFFYQKKYNSAWHKEEL